MSKNLDLVSVCFDQNALPPADLERFLCELPASRLEVAWKSPSSGEVARMNFESPGSRLGVARKSPGSRGEVGIQVARDSPANRPSECALLGRSLVADFKATHFKVTSTTLVKL